MNKCKRFRELGIFRVNIAQCYDVRLTLISTCGVCCAASLRHSDENRQHFKPVLALDNFNNCPTATGKQRGNHNLNLSASFQCIMLITCMYFNGFIMLYLYQIELPSNTATLLALFVRTELLCFCSCICQQTCVATNTAIEA